MSEKPLTPSDLKRYAMRFAADSGRRFYAERDGGPGRMSNYVIDRYADPMGPRGRTDCETHAEALKLARNWNAMPPWPVWDTIAAERDGYKTN